MSRQLWIGLFMVAIGVFNISGAIFNWDWYMYGTQGRFFMWLLGRTGARILYTFVSLGFITLGVMVMMGMISAAP